MKKYFYFTAVFLIFISNNTNSQCNVRINERDDGVTIHYTRPDRIGYCDKFVLGLSMQTNGSNYFLVSLCIFERAAQKIAGDFYIAFENNKSSRLQLYKSELTTIQGSPASLNIFLLDDNALNNIQNSNIKMASAQLDDGILQSIKIMANADKLKLDYYCLKNNK